MNLCSELDNVGWGTSPNDQAIAFINEAGLYFWIFKAEEALVNDELLVVWGEELFLLKTVAFGAVGMIQGLDFLRLVVTGSDEGLVWVLAWLQDNPR